VVKNSPAPPSRAAISAGLATIYLVWGSTYLAIRVAVETMPPFLMAAARFLLAGAALITFLRFRGAPWPTPRQWRLHALLGTLLLPG
jgi:drug/metabolite transporter (DMT)-like permease